MNEKEISKLITEHVHVHITGEWTEKFKVDGHNPYVAIEGATELAHAIAEKMAEGVVWEKVVELWRMGDHKMLMYGLGTEAECFTNSGEYYGELVGEVFEAIDFHRQRVRVTVTKEE